MLTPTIDQTTALAERALKTSCTNSDLVAARLREIHEDLVLHGGDKHRRAVATGQLLNVIAAIESDEVAKRASAREVERRLLDAVRSVAIEKKT